MLSDARDICDTAIVGRGQMDQIFAAVREAAHMRREVSPSTWSLMSTVDFVSLGKEKSLCYRHICGDV